MNKKQQLKQCFENALNYKIKYVAVLIKLPNDATELIINKHENCLEKLEYYQNAYDDDLKLNANKSIEIIDFSCGNNLMDIEYDLFS